MQIVAIQILHIALKENSKPVFANYYSNKKWPLCWIPDFWFRWFNKLEIDGLEIERCWTSSTNYRWNLSKNSFSKNLNGDLNYKCNSMQSGTFNQLIWNWIIYLQFLCQKEERSNWYLKKSSLDNPIHLNFRTIILSIKR